MDTYWIQQRESWLYPRRIFPWYQSFLRVMRLWVVTGSQYIGGIIGDDATNEYRIGEKVDGWKGPAKTLSGVSYRNPEAVYASLYN